MHPKGGEDMDFANIVAGYVAPACIISVEQLPNNEPGEIRIIQANDPYKKMMGPNYHDGVLYTDLIPKEIKFEHFLYEAAINHKQLHTYVKSISIGMWMDELYVPLSSDEANKGYCIFTYELTKEVSPDRMGNVSIDTASSVIKSCACFRTADSFKTAADEVLSELYHKTGAKSAILLNFDGENKTSGCISGIVEGLSEKEAIALVNAIPYEIVESWEDTVKSSNVTLIANEADMNVLEKKNSNWVRSLKESGVHNLCLVPLYQNKIIIGYLYVADFDTSKIIEVKELIELTSFFLAAELANYNLVKRLEILSNLDMLTGVYNRNAMNNKVDQFIKGPEMFLKAFGVAFVDLNGLKRTNDEQGHEAGDDMLIKAARVMKSIFKEDEIYRAGGDEFSIICQNISEDEFWSKINTLKEKTSYPSDTTCAVGACYVSEGSDIRKAMHEADVLMYKDKDAFYKLHPELKARK